MYADAQISGALVAEAGCTLQQCEDAAAEVGCRMPLDLGPRQQCHVGGNISTNAGEHMLVPASGKVKLAAG